MANRYWNMPSFQLEKGVTRLYCHLTFGASGAVTLDTANSKGFAKAVKSATGKYTLTLGTPMPAPFSNTLDTYYKVLSIHPAWDATGNSGTAPAAPYVYLIDNSVGTGGTASFEIECTNTSQAATSPASGEGLYLEIQLCNSHIY